MEKLLSVIVPVYNSEKYLARCLDSIIAQKYENLEIIIIDDGSPDNCMPIYEDYIQKDKRIKCYKQENQGVSVARNKGLEMATGDYITFIDSDDYISDEMYYLMMDKVKQYDLDVVMCDCMKVYEHGQEIYSHDIREGYYNRNQLENEYFKNLFIMPTIEYPPTISNWVIVFKKKITNPRYIQGVKYSEDLYFGAQLMYDASSFYYLKNKPLYYYDCTNINSATHKFTEDKWKSYKSIYKIAKKDFNENGGFDQQIDCMLLFFVYNYIGDIYKIKTDSILQKKAMILAVLSDEDVRRMFSKLSVRKLKVSIKLKILTIIYKYRVGLSWTINKFGGR